MLSMSLLALVLLLCVGQCPGVQGAAQECVSQRNCSECLRSPGCAWCKKRDFLKAGESSERRCDTAESLRSRGCSEEQENVIDPWPEHDFLKNQELSSKENNVVQLSPQNLHVKLRVGDPHEFKVSFKRAEGYPIDLYYLMDLSFSMKDDLDMIKNLGEVILQTLKKNTKNVRIGFGSFVDKVVLPYVSQVRARRRDPCPSRMHICQPAFSFHNILNLTTDASEFKRRVSNQSISGNLDSPEAGLDAIMQAAVCHDVINWRKVTRILVYTSDDTFHVAGDGRLAGIYEPHDGKCHLNDKGIDEGTKYDYPSVGHLARVLAANNIQLIFAVTEDSVPAYQALSKLIPQSVVGVLRNDSSNIVQLISEAYSNLSSTILLEQQGAPPGLEVSYRSKCVSGEASAPWQRRGECMNVKINEQVDFTVRLNITKCLNEKQQFQIKVQGISDTLTVSVETLCDCDCQDTERSSSHCSYNGTLSCGSCSCVEGRLGQRCECEQPQGTSSVDVTCRQGNSAPLCSGQGICECGKCRCLGSYRGDFCECDDGICPRHNHMLCGGHGVCTCGACVCSASHAGRACECSRDQDKCVTGAGGLCSGQGTCRCNQCQCNKDFVGKHCSMITNTCQMFKGCMTCVLDNEENLGPEKSCAAWCGSVKPSRLAGPQDFPCPISTISYKVEFSGGNVVVFYADLPRAVDKTVAIISGSVSGIIFIGISVVLVSRLLLELHYRREYRSFLREQEAADWTDTNNPLFQDATTTVINPMHMAD